MAVEVHNWREHRRNTLLGFATLRLTGVGIEIRDCPVHQKNGDRWLQMPSRPYEDAQGNQKYSYIIHFYNKEIWKKFQTSALAALDSYFAANQGDDPRDIPF
jgi:hypothetical protein